MNIISCLLLFIVGGVAWLRSGVFPTQRYFFVGCGILLVIWWVLWGQIAVYDQWWMYNKNNIGGFIGVVPAADMLYFLAGMGWSFYLCHKLELF